jgi:hypothetical protein
VIFKWKPKKITLDCFTFDAGVYEYAKIDKASKFIPKEAKRLGTKEHPTLKTCNGFLDQMTTGFVLPCWSDYKIHALDDGNLDWIAASQVANIESHSREQMWNGFYEDYANVKLISPWFINDKSGIKFAWVPPMWNNQPDNVKNMTGVIDFTYQNVTNVVLMLKKNTKLELEAGEPLAQMIPLTERKVELKHHLISTLDWNNRLLRPMKFKNTYGFRKKIVEERNSSCPFGFGK